MVAALATLIGLALTTERRRFPVSPPTVALALFTAWMSLGVPFSMFPEASYDMWIRVLKIQLMTLVCASLLASASMSSDSCG
jgi:hypothetical protein